MKFPADSRQSTNIEYYPEGMLRMTDKPQTSSLWEQIISGLQRGMQEGAYRPLGAPQGKLPVPTQQQLLTLPHPTPQPPATNNWEALALAGASRRQDEKSRVMNSGMGKDRTRPQAFDDSKGWTYVLPDGRRIGVGPEDPNWAGMQATPNVDPHWIVKALGGQ
jgi:hypothetical protein